jgi:tetratricopeptide (TPR) repeat protein
VDIDIGTALGLGRAAFARGDHAEAEAHFRAAYAAGQDDAEVHHHLAFLARGRDDLEEAAARYEDALELEPSDAHLHNNLAEVRRAQGRPAEAAALFQRALALAPDSPPVAANLGSLLLAMARPDLALPHLEYAASVAPGDIQVQSDRAVCLCSLNRYADALPVYREMYRHKPDHNDARYLESLALLALGDFENGWRKHESRWYARLGQPLRRAVQGPSWLGDDDLSGQAILVHAEQGHGDTIQYLRYVPLLRRRAARVLLEVQPALKALLDGTPDVFARGEALPDHTAHCSFMSLPRAFRTMPDTIPADVPYLSVPPAALARWRERLGPGDGRRRIAVAWTGASAVWNRSIPLRLLVPLLQRPDCAFHVVQTDMEPGDREILRGLPGVADHSQALDSFADSAAIVALMDLVVTVDTALGHLAGALAKPVWTMLPFGAEYRWRTEGTDSAWYPTMRLFRQPALNDWASVTGAVQAALSA